MEGRAAQLTVRLATPADVDLLAPIEVAAGARFREVGMADVADDDPPPRAQYEEAVRRGHLWVAELDGAVVGYAWGVLLDGQHHLEQVSVLPGASGAGVGTALVEQVASWARTDGGSSLTLSTFSDVPWNGPWYARRGFAPVPDDEVATSPRWQALRRHEREAGLDVDARIVMRRAL